MAARPQISLASPNEGRAVRDLLLSSSDSSVEWMDWSDIGSNWLVATLSGQMVGCLQVLPGKPMGRLEHLGLAPKLTHSQRAVTTKFLIEQGFTTLRLYGSNAAMAFIPFDLKQYKRILKRRGCEVMSAGNFMMKRLS